MGDKEIT